MEAAFWSGKQFPFSFLYGGRHSSTFLPEWRVVQTYVGTKEELVGFISLESLADQKGRYAAVDVHIGPAG